jgi:hypothetical protein
MMKVRWNLRQETAERYRIKVDIWLAEMRAKWYPDSVLCQEYLLDDRGRSYLATRLRQFIVHNQPSFHE